MKHYKDFKSQQKIAQRQKIDAKRNYIAHNKCHLIVKWKKKPNNKTFFQVLLCYLLVLDLNIFSSLLSMRQIMHLCIAHYIVYGQEKCGCVMHTLSFKVFRHRSEQKSTKKKILFAYVLLLTTTQYTFTLIFGCFLMLKMWHLLF